MCTMLLPKWNDDLEKFHQAMTAFQDWGRSSLIWNLSYNDFWANVLDLHTANFEIWKFKFFCKQTQNIWQDFKQWLRQKLMMDDKPPPPPNSIAVVQIWQLRAKADAVHTHTRLNAKMSKIIYVNLPHVKFCNLKILFIKFCVSFFFGFVFGIYQFSKQFIASD